MADIYCLFYERGGQLLNKGGILSYITSNKWMRAGYGEKLRHYFCQKIQTRDVLDFGGTLVFSSATVDSAIVIFSNDDPINNFRSTFISGEFSLSSSFQDYIAENSIVYEKPDSGSSSWVVSTPERHAIKQQVEALGIPLKQWEVQINYGVKTGFNDAFYLTQEQRDTFIEEDPDCADYLVSLVRGRYISRYKSDWDGTWMIATFPVLNLKWMS
jgi:hypothetical protein